MRLTDCMGGDGTITNITIGRVCNSKYEPTAMNDFMHSVKHLTEVLIVGVYRVDQSRKFADSDVMKNLHFRSNCGL